MAKTPKDLHAAKKSHLTVPIRHGIEIHLDKQDMPKKKEKVGDKAMAHIPMVVTSVDKGHRRYKQTSRLKIHTESVDEKVKKVSNRIFKRGT